MTPLPQDIHHREWYNIIRRLQSVAKTEGCAILTIKVAVSADGRPLCYTQPGIVKLEPKRTCHFTDLEEEFTAAQMGAVLEAMGE